VTGGFQVPIMLVKGVQSLLFELVLDGMHACSLVDLDQI